MLVESEFAGAMLRIRDALKLPNNPALGVDEFVAEIERLRNPELNPAFSAYQQVLIQARWCLGYELWADQVTESQKTNLDSLRAYIHGMIQETGLTIFSGTQIAPVQSPGNPQGPDPGAQGGQDSGI
jgi:hypothetical protein